LIIKKKKKKKTRWIETWSFPDGASLKTHESVRLVVNNDCLVTDINEIVDSREQQAVWGKIGQLIAALSFEKEDL